MTPRHGAVQIARRQLPTWLMVLLALTGLGTEVALCDENPDLQYPAPIRQIQIEGGYRLNQNAGQDNSSYYEVSYAGSLIDTKGTPFKLASHFEITEPTPDAAGGDRPELLLKLQRGHGSLGGDLLQGDGAMPLPLRGLDSLRLRGAAYVGFDLDGKRAKGALGLESPPLRLPGLSAAGFSNWLVIGAMAERNEATDSASEDKTYALATGRLFLGRAFGWHKSANVGETAHKIASIILTAAPDKDSAAALVEKLKAIHAANRNKIQQLVIDTFEDLDDTEEWDKTVQAAALGTADAITDQQTMAVYLEGSGWYGSAKDVTQPRDRGLLSLSIDYWPLKSRDDVILRARYDWGFERLQPNLRVNQITVALVASF